MERRRTDGLTDGSWDARRPYEPPAIITYSGDDILAEIGPAQACSPFSGALKRQGSQPKRPVGQCNISP
ncbi:MAG: hypothetical protein ACUVXD_12330 [Thermodesulfobacteriota bacterium]